ncbi:outer membrane protein, OMP85 family [Tannerella forsythia 92A2]|uniref:Outer membrane protein, OMP85 family n=1 Tax=Tannerella forsythia (strain ATCC 43037 / JCM 10827 / CCUG 21028 A / KCTC 5666 / FDC 338) TaxID=203275 RepID=G8UQ56_TANFA|nr:BamA/TamA family outer membrane protein [Tannerella forsythia]AEW20772.1 outer membrane protein, OMP85 family [Tannerella forsythia 92A2]OLQ20450.1 hypothetical protein BGK60_07765 [Tannerella forsythia]
MNSWIGTGIVGLLLGGLCACSTTKNLPKGEVLYTGIESITVTDREHVREADEVLGKVEEALAYPPNNALLGSSSKRTPFPLGLWMYNAHVNKKGAFHEWMFRWLAAKPVFISTVTPATRARVAQNLLRENGYFTGTASCEIVPNKKDSLKAGVRYEITLNEPYTLDSIFYRRMQNRGDTLLKLQEDKRLLRKGDRFSIETLEAERQRLATIMRNNGYYFFRPEYIIYQADSSLREKKVDLRVGLKQGVPETLLRPWNIGRISIYLSGYDNEMPTDSISYKDLTIYYENRLRVKPSVLYKQLQFTCGELYSLEKQTETQLALSRLGIFRYTDMQYMPTDSSHTSDTMNVQIYTSYDYPFNSRFEIKATMNDNNYAGPGIVLGVTRRNMFGGGETLAASLFGSYEWQTGVRAAGHTGMVNNYEVGAKGTLTFPRLVLPRLGRGAYDFSASTRMDAQISQLNRAHFFRQLVFGGSLAYEFVPNPIRRHTFTPVRLTFSRLLHTTQRFDSIVSLNPSVRQSLQDQFFPAIEYSYTLDNSSVREERSKTWWRFSVSEAGNLLSGAYALFGRRFNDEKRLLGNPFSQFLKVTTELRYNHYINRNHRLAFRVGGGVIYSYGNTLQAPYGEQFYVGGANSIRAFTIRSVGPGRFAPDRDNPYAYIDQIGDIKFEANAEYRFRLVGDLDGAVYLDMGNVWLMRNDRARPGGQLKWKHFLNDIATGTGVGFRYDMDVLVFRFDIGYALHFPYSTDRRGYFNAPSLRDALGFHLALGYPF